MKRLPLSKMTEEELMIAENYEALSDENRELYMLLQDRSGLTTIPVKQLIGILEELAELETYCDILEKRLED